MHRLLLSLAAILSAFVIVVAAKERCGPGHGNCDPGFCCSQYYYCGTTPDYCEKNCNINFGICGSPANTLLQTKPSNRPHNSEDDDSTDTHDGGFDDVSSDPRVITRCTVPRTIAITFDDGPSEYTNHLLGVLRTLHVRATFFYNGKNSVDASLPEYQAVLRRIYEDGHQLASHTLTHADLSKADDGEVRYEMIANERILVTAIGKRPRYMRPPFGETTAHTVDLLEGMNYRVVNWSADTKDYEHKSASKSARVYDRIVNANDQGEFIILQHDLIKSTSYSLMEKVVGKIKEKGWRMVTVAECLGDPNGAYQ